jgi:hypothetical protein
LRPLEQIALMFVLALCVSNPGIAFDTKKETAGQVVDSGSFGVFVNGRRIATETFSVQKNGAGSIATSEFKTEEGTDKAMQSSELQLTASGDLRKYEWKELSPGKAQAMVVPNDNLLVERSTENPQAKQDEHPFLLPVSTNILDDYFFIHREILAWKYLATGCKQQNGGLFCPKEQEAKFGVLNPHARASMLVTMAFAGREKIPVRGVERELNHFTLQGEAGDWSLWLDDQFKLVRIVVKGDNTEIVRD